MPTVATLVVEMAANTADFVSTWDKTRKEIGKGSQAFKDAEKSALSFASKGLGDLAGGMGGLDRMFEKLLSNASKSGNVFVKIGAGAIAMAGAFKEAWDVGQKLGEFLRETAIPKLTGQESTEKMLERLKAENEAQKKFLDERRAAVALERDIVQSTTKARTDAAAARAKADGDEIASAFAKLKGDLEIIEQEKQARTAASLAATTDAQQRARLLVAIDQEAAQKRIAAHANYAATATQIENERSAKQIETLKRENDLLQQSIDQAIALRQKLSQAGSLAAEALNITGVTDIDKVQQFLDRIEAVRIKFALLRDAGVPVRDLMPEIAKASDQAQTEFQQLTTAVQQTPAALDILNTGFQRVNFGDFRTGVENARSELQTMGVTLAQIGTQQASANQQLNQLPDVARRAGTAIDDLNVRYQRLQLSIAAATQQLYNYDRAAATVAQGG